MDEARVGQLVLDGDVILPADGATINERRRLSYGGLITVALPVGEDGRLAGDPLVRPFGVPVEEDRDDFIADATGAAAHAYSPGGDEERVREAVHARFEFAIRESQRPVDDGRLVGVQPRGPTQEIVDQKRDSHRSFLSPLRGAS